MALEGSNNMALALARQVVSSHHSVRKRLFEDVDVEADGVHSKRRCSQQPLRTRKHVRFDNNNDREKLFETFDDSTLLWYQEEDYKRIREEARATVLALESKHILGEVNDIAAVLDASEYCLRGLENVVAQLLYRVMRQRSKKVVNAVLCQQEMQRQNGQKNVEAIRLSSSIMSLSDRRKAWTRAQRDDLVL